jgi:hypothetical protein
MSSGLRERATILVLSRRAMGSNDALPLPSFQQAGRAAPIFGCQTPEDWMKFIAGETRVGLFKKVVRVIQLELEN